MQLIPLAQISSGKALVYTRETKIQNPTHLEIQTVLLGGTENK